MAVPTGYPRSTWSVADLSDLDKSNLLGQGPLGTLSAALGTVTATGPVSVSGTTVTITSGAGAPAAVTPNGSLYLRTDGAASTRLYISNGATWVAVTSA